MVEPSSQPQVRDPERFTGHKIHLPIFEGPFDLLLYLVRAHRYDICDIPISKITSQFIEFLALMREVEADYAGDFLVTAATLMQIKARMLLPKSESASEEIIEEGGQDPRKELVDRLLEYQKIQEAAEELREKRDEWSEFFGRSLEARKNLPDFDAELSQSLLFQEISSFDLLSALKRVLKRLEERPIALVQREPFSLPERLKVLSARLYHTGQMTFDGLCDDCESRLEIVITFLAILELIKRGRLKVRHLTLFDDIYLETA